MRGAFDASAEVPVFRYFPGACEIAEDRFPTLDTIRGALMKAGLGQLAHEVVPQVVASSLRDLYERTRLRADSTLELLPDAEFHRGLAQLASDAAEETSPQAVTEELELLVFG